MRGYPYQDKDFPNVMICVLLAHVCKRQVCNQLYMYVYLLQCNCTLFCTLYSVYLHMYLSSTVYCHAHHAPA